MAYSGFHARVHLSRLGCCFGKRRTSTSSTLPKRASIVYEKVEWGSDLCVVCKNACTHGLTVTPLQTLVQVWNWTVIILVGSSISDEGDGKPTIVLHLKTTCQHADLSSTNSWHSSQHLGCFGFISSQYLIISLISIRQLSPEITPVSSRFLPRLSHRCLPQQMAGVLTHVLLLVRCCFTVVEMLRMLNQMCFLFLLPVSNLSGWE